MNPMTDEQRAATALEQAIAYFFRGHVDVALKKLRKSLSVRRNPSAHFWLGLIPFVDNDFERGLAACREGLAEFPDEASLHACAALNLASLRDADGAEGAIVRAEALDGGAFFTLFGRGAVHLEARRPEAALPHLERALAVAGPETAVFAQLQIGRCHHYLAKETLSPYHLAASVRSFRAAVLARPDWHFVYCAALMYTERHPDPRIPLAIAEEGIARFPGSRAIMLYALRPLLRENRLVEAADAYTAVVSHFRHDVEALIHVAKVTIEYAELTDYALEALYTAERYNPDDPRVARAFLIAYTKLDQPDESARWRERLEQLTNEP